MIKQDYIKTCQQIIKHYDNQEEIPLDLIIQYNKNVNRHTDAQKYCKVARTYQINTIIPKTNKSS